MDQTAQMILPQALLGADIRIPLIVDLDQTLILTDTVQEVYAKLLFSGPSRVLASLRAILEGRGAFETRLAEWSMLDATCLPYRTPLLDLLRQEKARGRSIHLVTAADQKTADAVAAHLGLFASAAGSEGNRSFKGKQKLEYLHQRFASGFIYVGGTAADLPLYKEARGAILCDVSRHVVAADHDEANILVDLRRPRRGPGVWLRAGRVHQWSKNVLIFLPLFVGHAYTNPAAILTVAAGFLLVCLLASATYIVNDIGDLDADRMHQTKRLRPFASGDLSIALGLTIAPLVITAAFIGSYLLAPTFALAMLLYLCLTLAYSFGLKQLPLLDVSVISTLLVLRIVMGTELIGLAHSSWLLSFAWVFFLSLALAKRHVEVARAGHIEDVAGRGYRGGDWPLTLSFGIGSGLVSIVIMLLYLTNDAAPSGFYVNAIWLYAIPALVIMWLMRIWLLSTRTELDDDPIVFALRDRTSLALGAGVVVAFFLAS